MKLVYLVGPPGVGKSTLMQNLTARCRRESETKPFAHDWLYRDTTPVAIELGRRREAFSGTDALSMSVQPRAVEWIGGKRHELILAEGARLATYGFLTAARAAGYAVTLVHLCATERALQERRERRGSDQNPTWIQGATSRARRITEQMELDSTTTALSAERPVDQVLQTLLEAEPALKALTDD